MTSENSNQINAMLRVHSVNTLPAPQPGLPAEPLQEQDAFSSALVRLLAEEGEGLVRALEARLDTLQEGFLDTLNRQLAERQMHPADRLHLFLSPEGSLMVEGNDSDADMLCEIIDRRPDLRASFREMAQMAMLSHGVELATRARNGMEGKDDGDIAPLLGHYHMCLKGSLSHFYIR